MRLILCCLACVFGVAIFAWLIPYQVNIEWRDEKKPAPAMKDMECSADSAGLNKAMKIKCIHAGENIWRDEDCRAAMINKDKEGCPDICDVAGPRCIFNEKYARKIYKGKDKYGWDVYEIESTWKAPLKNEIYQGNKQ